LSLPEYGKKPDMHDYPHSQKWEIKALQLSFFPFYSMHNKHQQMTEFFLIVGIILKLTA
jgi:hypothetical protein